MTYILDSVTKGYCEENIEKKNGLQIKFNIIWTKERGYDFSVNGNLNVDWDKKNVAFSGNCDKRLSE